MQPLLNLLGLFPFLDDGDGRAAHSFVSDLCLWICVGFTADAMKHDNLAPLFFVLSALAVMMIGWLTRSSWHITKEISKPLGGAIFLLGMGAFVWIIFYLREAFLGDIAPVTDLLVTSGPYRWVRHPLYLSMIVILVGIAIIFRSLWGVVGVFVLFLPALVYRAKLEEQALSGKFGHTWEVYLQRTYFLIPPLW